MWALRSDLRSRQVLYRWSCLLDLQTLSDPSLSTLPELHHKASMVSALSNDPHCSLRHVFHVPALLTLGLGHQYFMSWMTNHTGLFKATE